MSVSLAEYTASSSADIPVVLELNTRCIPEDCRNSFQNSLPEALRPMKSSIVVLSNCFDQATTEELLSSLEIEMMITACSYGDIDVIERTISPSSGSQLDDDDNQALRVVFGDCGCFFIAFRDDHTAEACAVALHKSMFNNRTIAAHWMPKVPIVHIKEDSLADNDQMVIEEHPNITADETIVDEEDIQQDADDVEDFLNSLL